MADWHGFSEKSQSLWIIEWKLTFTVLKIATEWCAILTFGFVADYTELFFLHIDYLKESDL